MATAAASVTADDVRTALTQALGAGSAIEVTDVSGGCGAAFEVAIVSGSLAGPRLGRHRKIQSALSGLMPSIHALSIKKAVTPEEEAAKEAG
jgi:BolA protein